MHEFHAVEAGLAHGPVDVKDLIQHIPAAGGLTFQLLRDDANPRAEEMTVKARKLITSRHCTGAIRLPGAPPVWEIHWTCEDLVLAGHLYRDLNQPTHPDPQSPILLYSRFTLIAAYGPPVPQLAYHVLAYSLAWSGLHDPSPAPEEPQEP